MNFYNRSDFLNIFDTEKIIDSQVGIMDYDLKVQDGFVINFFMIIAEGTVCVTYSSPSYTLISFSLHEVTNIILQRSHGVTELLIYKGSVIEPVVTISIQPNLKISLTTESLV